MVNCYLMALGGQPRPRRAIMPPRHLANARAFRAAFRENRHLALRAPRSPTARARKDLDPPRRRQIKFRHVCVGAPYRSDYCRRCSNKTDGGKTPVIFIRASLASGVAIGTFVHGPKIEILPSNSNSPLIWRPNSPASARRKICLGFGLTEAEAEGPSGQGGLSLKSWIRWVRDGSCGSLDFSAPRSSDATWSKHIAVLLANLTILMSVTAVKARSIGHGHFLRARSEPQGSLRSKTNSWLGSQYRRPESRSLPGSG